MGAYEKQREQIEKKSEHIARLTKSLNELHQHLKVTRSQYQKRATAMLAAAATLTEEVRLSRLDAPMADAGEAENSETESADQPETGQATPIGSGSVEQPSIEPKETSSETSTGWPEAVSYTHLTLPTNREV